MWVLTRPATQAKNGMDPDNTEAWTSWILNLYSSKQRQAGLHEQSVSEALRECKHVWNISMYCISLTAPIINKYYIYIYIYIYIYYVYIYIYICVCVCVHICVRVCVCLKKCLGDGVRSRIVTVYVHICVYIYIYILYDYICVCACVYNL